MSLKLMIRTAASFLALSQAHAADFVVYSVFRPLDLGNKGEPPPQHTYYINMGSKNGLHVGSSVTVLRKIATYDLVSQKLYKDIEFPFAKLKIVHVEGTAAIAKLDGFLSADQTVALDTRAIMVGDIVKLGQ